MIAVQLLDARTTPEIWDKFRADMAATQDVIGIDCETQDRNRHPGLEAFNNKTRHVFDHRRTIMTGMSFYPNGAETAYYVNLNQADVENRLPAEIVRVILLMKPEGVTWVAHNAPFELVMFEQCYGVGDLLTDMICTLQMAVSDHGPDEYDIQKFYATPMNGIKPLISDILQNFRTYDPAAGARSLNADQQFVLGQFIGKESDAAHSYNGFTKSIAWGFSLKKLTKSLFNVDQTTYQEVLDAHGAEDMADLNGEQVAAYGADDAFWAVAVYRALLDKMMRENPAALVTFLEGENPMIHTYAETWRCGLRINTAEVYEYQIKERAAYAEVLRALKAEVRKLLPFPDGPNPQLMEWQTKWYPQHWPTKREQIAEWAMSPDDADDFEQCFQVSNPVGNAWATERGIKVPKSSRLNLSHYYAMRVLLHDLLGHRLVRIGGEISTDKEARGRMFKTFEDAGDVARCRVMNLLTETAQIEQRMKLYITPYSQLIDPDTGRMYSVISSMLATRRMAARFPNPMQLAKSGSSKYIRGFYLPDRDDHVTISSDWSSVELVEIGEFSGDPGFKEAFGQLPYGDLHAGAAVDALNVNPEFADLTLEEFKLFKRGQNPNTRRLINFDGLPVSPEDFFKLYRSTEVGKGISFGYWYSGAIGTVAERLGWTSDQMWEAVERYRARFPLAEAWRVELIDTARRQGFVTLPDGHRRVRFEATDTWGSVMRRKFADVCPDPAVLRYADIAIKRLQTRAGNQAVNGFVQGMCARLAKDSEQALRRTANRDAYRFLLPVHDELVFSVHKDYVSEFIPLLRTAMCDHPKYFKTLPLNVNVAMGRTFKPFDKMNPAFSQIELDEAPLIDGVIGPEWEGKALSEDKIAEVVNWMMAA